MGMGGYSVLLLMSMSIGLVVNQALIPPRYDGFVYGNVKLNTDTISIEAFLDPTCPDSRDSWRPLKRALKFYGSLVSLITHPFSLPYHDNSFIASRSLHVINNLNSSYTYKVLESFFSNQEKFYNQHTLNYSRSYVINQVIDFLVNVVGNSHYGPSIKAGFRDSHTDHLTRVSFKYGCTRGVYGAPFFFVNGFQLPNPGSAIDYQGWRSVIDPLIGNMVKTRFNNK